MVFRIFFDEISMHFTKQHEFNLKLNEFLKEKFMTKKVEEEFEILLIFKCLCTV